MSPAYGMNVVTEDLYREFQLIPYAQATDNTSWDRYWDWSLDWKNLSQSPVFQSAPGFGGNSQPTSLASKDALVGGDRCVEDGPWAGMMVHWWSQKAAPHCLSRGFQDVTPMDDMGHHLSSEILTLLHQQPDYESFFLMMEHGVHNAVQIAIGGDIMFNTAPYG